MSKSKLVPMLIENGFIESEKKNVSYEAYGRDVRAYVQVADMQQRAKLESFLRAKSIKFFSDYWPGAPYVEVKVSYFKAWHHDE
jgi:hypothetical protein